MSPRMFANGALCALLVTAALTCVPRGNCEDQKGSTRDGDQGGATAKYEKARGAELEKLIYARLSKDGRFSHPKFPYVLRVESVQGRKLLGVKLMRRDKSGKGYDMVGKAREAELRVDSTHQVIQVRMQKGGFFFEDEETEACFKEKIHEVALPADWRNLLTKSSETPGKDDDPPLSAKAKAFLAKELFPSEHPVDKRLRLAFGDNCQELKATIILDIGSRGLVLTGDTCNLEPDGRLKLTPCSIALFPKGRGDVDVPPITTIRSASAFLKLDRPIKNGLWDLTDLKIVSVELAGGLHVSLDKE